MPVARYDASPLGSVTRTTQGFLRAPARVTRTGVLTYRRADGTLVRELRRPEQVFAAQSLATLSDAPVTDLHPKGMVTPQNARQLALGHVSGGARGDGKRFVEAQLLITDAKLIEAVERKDRVEASCGYTCELIPAGGTYQGERYDAEQTNIVYNHVGLGPRGWGRAGADVAVRLDGAEPDDFRLEGDAAQLAEPHPPYKGPTPMELVTIRLDGIEAQVSPTASQLITRTLEQHDQKAAAAEAKALELQRRNDALAGELDAVKKQLTAASDPQRFDSAVQTRLDLLARVRNVLPDDADLAGKSARDIQLLTLKALHVDGTFEGKSDEYIAAYFDRELAAHAQEPAQPLRSRQRSDGNGNGNRGRAGGTSPAELERIRREASLSRLDNNDDVAGILAGRYSQSPAQADPNALTPWRAPLATHRER